MNGLLASVFILWFASHHASAAPTPQQQFQSHEYKIHSVYPSYNVHHQSFSGNTYSNPFSPSAYVQNPLPLNPPLSFNSSESTALEKTKKENEENRVPIKLDQKADGKSVHLGDQGSVNVAVIPFTADGKTVGAPVLGGYHHSADPIFGPEIGSKYEIYYSPEHLSSFSGFSAYAAYPGQATFSAHPSAFSSYSAFPTYSAYPNYGGSNPFVGAVDTASLSGNKIDGLPSNAPLPASSAIGGVPSYPTGGTEASTQSSTEAANEISSESNVGAPPSIDAPSPSARIFPTNNVPAKPTIRKT